MFLVPKNACQGRFPPLKPLPENIPHDAHRHIPRSLGWPC